MHQTTIGDTHIEQRTSPSLAFVDPGASNSMPYIMPPRLEWSTVPAKRTVPYLPPTITRCPSYRSLSPPRSRGGNDVLVLSSSSSLRSPTSENPPPSTAGDELLQPIRHVHESPHAFPLRQPRRPLRSELYRCVNSFPRRAQPRREDRNTMGGPGNITTSDAVVLEVLIKVSASLSLVGSLFIIVSYILFKVSQL